MHQCGSMAGIVHEVYPHDEPVVSHVTHTREEDARAIAMGESPAEWLALESVSTGGFELCETQRRSQHGANSQRVLKVDTSTWQGGDLLSLCWM